MSDPSIQSDRFPWTQTGARLRDLAALQHLEPDRKGRAFVTRDGGAEPRLRFLPPLVQPIPPEARTPGDYIASLAPFLGGHLVVLIQAGSAALGAWRAGVPLHHKVIRKYMIRGHGKFQGTYLKTKGKSRYGSRLRLRNAVDFFQEINVKLREWSARSGPFDAVFYSCPVRLWGELFRAKTPPPFERDGPLVKIPLDVRVPSFRELRHVYHELTHGSIRIGTEPAPPTP